MRTHTPTLDEVLSSLVTAVFPLLYALSEVLSSFVRTHTPTLDEVSSSLVTMVFP